MQDDKWEAALDKIQDQFEVLEQGEESLEAGPGGRVEFIVFNSPMGRLRVERTTKPKVIDKKSFGGSKYGASTGVEYIYSDTEQVKTVQAFRDSNGEWQPIEAESLI